MAIKSFSMDDELINRLELIAEKNDIKQSQLLRLILKQSLIKIETHGIGHLYPAPTRRDFDNY